MSTVISFRIPRDLKKKMEALKDKVNWSEEIRKFIEEKVREVERKEALKRIEELLKNIPTKPRGAISSIVREDRDSH
ncbi:MAG: hypothetical protein DRJ40_06325 [Thermoprotei archaeon]|nr:MAG: hypothetical protein DRJ40_06325 [Thermoprotei archaeon]